MSLCDLWAGKGNSAYQCDECENNLKNSIAPSSRLYHISVVAPLFERNSRRAYPRNGRPMTGQMGP